MGEEKKEKSRWVKGKKEAWLLAQEVKRFEAERRENLTKTDKDSCLGNLRYWLALDQRPLSFAVACWDRFKVGKKKGWNQLDFFLELRSRPY